MISKKIDVRGLSCEDAVKLLCEELNKIRTDMEKRFEMIDGETVIMPDGKTLKEHIGEQEG